MALAAKNETLEFRGKHTLDRWNVNQDIKAPDIEEARKFWDLHTVPRYKKVVEDGVETLEKCEPGVEGTFYDIIWTPINELRDFGIGLTMYFRTLLYIAASSIIVGLINIAAMNYFLSDEYGGQQDDMVWAIRGSAACAPEIICLDATCGETAEAQVCPFAPVIAWTDFAAFFVLVIGLVLLTIKQSRLATELDEAEQTAQDYSIRVEDPSPDAVDPDLWKDFFGDFGQVRFITVTRRNGQLLELLAERRFIRKQLEFKQKEIEKLEASHTTFRTKQGWRGMLQKVGIGCDFPYWALRMQEINEKIGAELKKPEIREAAKVYVTFNTERGQRNCLKSMTDGAINTFFDANLTGWFTGHHVAKLWVDKDGENKLAVVEAPEPSDVIWKNQSVPFQFRYLEIFIGFFLCGVVVAAAGAVIEAFVAAGMPGMVATFISLSNSVLPTLMKMFTEVESHLTFSAKQTSMLVKLVVARWFTTSIIYSIITATEDTADEATIEQIYNILFADAVTTPALRLLDVGGRIQRYLVAPGASLPCLAGAFPGANTQGEMNKSFEGTEWSLAERYTDLTKTVFVSLFNMSVYPAGVFITAFAMIVNFWVDKYCLLRIWAPQPELGAGITTTNRSYIALVLLFHFMVALHVYAAWPFDGYIDTGEPTTVTGVSARENVYEKVGDMTARGPSVFLINTRRWMSGDQKGVVKVFSAFSVVVFVVFILTYFGQGLYDAYRMLTTGIYEEPGEDQGITHVSHTGEDAIDVYVPKIHQPGIKYPLLAAKITFPLDHLPFKIHPDEVGHYNLYEELIDPKFTHGAKENENVFSIVRQYPVRDYRGTSL
uniref:CSC1/OSCA1-like cytosolic domain-containing protein n=1 Tax=Phaeomonas parva TaxID=124430 RepID=A0A7S1XQ05_9STRA|mmetsp:Transcript_23260/g.72715  ORF Transcript_23260/g.72715 Transcript_23260/m.72715 type:complete len:829 (+) Transcript_23260:149-2635(+)|eukprot:CAMPEP_0118882332 /NCGR_PEP_ID=MMETSP1163-20130328/21609_1 /TAXON_ID=124430 /ORGANISM="Phaeomonas parva, Strain CCMP2877" /LENGTH=828 /DNA_ID=CAMNT_0006819361 /DNA_START=133 /DNA_END=2619 /DNA_ORIENTATION=-